MQWPDYFSDTGSDCCFMCLVDRTKHYPPPLIINPASSLWQPITGCIVSQLKRERSCREFTCLQTINSGIVNALSSLFLWVEKDTFSSSMSEHLLTLYTQTFVCYFCRYLGWDVPQEMFYVKSVQNKETSLARQVRTVFLFHIRFVPH